MDNSTYQELVKNLVQQNQKIEDYKSQTGLTNADLTEAAGPIDRAITGFNLGTYQSESIFEKRINDKAQESINAYYQSQGMTEEQQLKASISTIPFFNQSTEKLKEISQEILQARQNNILNYEGAPIDGVKTYDEVRKEVIQDYINETALDQAQTANSTLSGKVGFALGAMGGFMADPFNLTTTVGGTGLAYKAVQGALELGTGIQALKGGLQMMAYESAIAGVQTAQMLPHESRLQEEAFGKPYTPEQAATELGLNIGITAVASGLGSGLARVLSRGQRVVSHVEEAPTVEANVEQPTPVKDPLQDNGPITKEFEQRFNNVKDNMDPYEASIIQDTIDAARMTPEHLNQTQHAENYRVATESMSNGRDFDVPFKNPEDNVPGTSPEPVTTANPSEPTLMDLENWTKDIPVDKQFEEINNSLLNDLDTRYKDVELPPDETGVKTTIDDLRTRLNNAKNDTDAIDKIIACYQQGGPSLNGT